MLTIGARTLLLHGIIMWPQIIGKMFWTFSMKSVAERIKSLQVDVLGRTPEYIMHGVEVKDTPIKSYYTLF